LVVTIRIFRAVAARNIESASAWCWSRALTSAIQAPLSTNSRTGPAAPRAVWRGLLGNERLRQVAVELLAAVGREPVDHTAGGEQRILAARPRERANGGANRLRFRPPAIPGPRLQALELRLVEVDLEWSAHDQKR
jgi:hypothetical protein